MMRSGIEWHDSELVALRHEPWGYLLVVNAVIHKTTGVPGVDPGTVWRQAAEVRLPAGRLRGVPVVEPPDRPTGIWDGSLITMGHVPNDLIPCPFHSDGEATIDLSFDQGARLVIKADGLTIDLIGEPTYLEDFR